MKNFIQELIKPFLLEDGEKQTLVIYPGRFQPAGKHHKAVYEWAVKTYGDNVYIATSDKVELPKSPLNFEEKKSILVKHGIPSNKIVNVKDPYRAIEITSKFDPKNTELLFIVGKKDMEEDPRFSKFTKKDGSLSYLQKDVGNKKRETFDKHGYLVVTPHIKIDMGGIEMSGTSIRNKLKNGSKQDFKNIMGWYDEKIYNSIKIAFNKLNEGGAYGHLTHVYEDSDLKFIDILNIINGISSGEIEVVEKTDGMNIMVSYRNGKLISARSKSHLKNAGLQALSKEELKQKFSGRGNIEKAFSTAIDEFDNAIKSMSDVDKQEIFKDGRVFLNIEIITPETENVIPYDTSYLQIHGSIEYDMDGNAVSDGKSSSHIISKMNYKGNIPIIGANRIVQLLNSKKTIQNLKNKYSQELSEFLKENNLKLTDNIEKYIKYRWINYIKNNFKNIPNDIVDVLVDRFAFNKKSITLNKLNLDKNTIQQIKDFENSKHKFVYKDLIFPLEIFILRFSADILSQFTNYLALNADVSKQKILDKLKNTIQNVEDSEKLQFELKRLKNIAGENFEKIVPSEGVVFNYNNKTYKLTGAFAPSNQILGMIKFKNNE
jgi:hypothetical protein